MGEQQTCNLCVAGSNPAPQWPCTPFPEPWEGRRGVHAEGEAPRLRPRRQARSNRCPALCRRGYRQRIRGARRMHRERVRPLVRAGAHRPEALPQSPARTRIGEHPPADLFRTVAVPAKAGIRSHEGPPRGCPGSRLSPGRRVCLGVTICADRYMLHRSKKWLQSLRCRINARLPIRHGAGTDAREEDRP